MENTGHEQMTVAADSDVQQFLLWILQSFGLRTQCDTRGVYTIELDEEPARAELTGQVPDDCAAREVVGRQFVLQSSSGAAGKVPADIEALTFGSPLGKWICARVDPAHAVLQAAPADQPVSIHELAPALFAFYAVDDGHVHLTGCRLEDRPFMRLSYLDHADTAPADQLMECFASSDGRLLDPAACRELQLIHLTPLDGTLRRLDKSVLQQWIEVADRKCRQQMASAAYTLIAATIIWCKFAVGKLSFSAQSASAELEFSGWARLIRDGVAVLPPYKCPWTGEQSYHLAATDDGRITVASAIATCAQSGQRVLKSELEQCAVSGQQVLAEYLYPCPITGQRVLRQHLATCAMCGEQVCTHAVARGICAACRHLHPVSRDDPIMARILGTYPKLEGSRSWKMSETDTVYVLVGTQLWSRLLVVFSKETLEPLRVATAGRLSRRWNDMTELQRSEWLE